MTIFFLLVGLEIERELYIGELSDRKRALLPIIGAFGGMLMPALLFFLVTMAHPELLNGAGIPTATDIAFAIAIMGLLGDKVPPALKVFLTALAIIDDLGALFVIAIFYGSGFSSLFLGLTVFIIAVLYLLNKRQYNNGWVYAILGTALWFCMLHSGIHATLAGVILAFAIPFENGSQHTLSYRLEHFLQKPVAFFILPLFALANTAIPFQSSIIELSSHPLALGILAGLVLGKPLGIVSFSLLAEKLGIASISKNISTKQLIGAGILGGIGFTMSIFVTNLAFNDLALIDIGKIAILIASTAAATIGYLLLR
jgi:NhaA family Na+:H+ antiporter